MEYEAIIKNIRFSKKSFPVRFAYTKNIESPENHKLHINKFLEIYIYVKGDADYIVGDSYFTLKRGDIVLINQYETHKAVLKKRCFYERFYILVPIDSFDDFYFNPLDKINKKLVSLEKDEREHALSILYEIAATLKEDENEEGCFKAYGLFLEFLSLVSSAFSKGDKTVKEQERPSRLPKYISEILKYIDQNAAKIESVEELARRFGLSMPYLSSTFKSKIGTPIKSYIQAKKIAYAKELLDNDYSVTDACYECGFNDCSYFIKVFKRHIGVTPYRYKNAQ